MNRPRSLILVFLLVGLVLTACSKEQEILPEEDKQEAENLLEDRGAKEELDKILNKYNQDLKDQDKIEVLDSKAYRKEDRDEVYALSVSIKKKLDNIEDLRAFSQKHSELIEREVFKDLDYEKFSFIWTNGAKDQDYLEYIFYK